jgi:hypothetical protein
MNLIKLLLVFCVISSVLLIIGLATRGIGLLFLLLICLALLKLLPQEV